ncbi:MAG: hypothetical protein LBP79_06530 [Clostridiales bacterium]|jgi:YegS/Rv2252/BmrU family lipid kinase|nr:hypothetical protein [Clostridiales bacterium]
MNCLIINNPVSGHSKTEREIQIITEKLKTKFAPVDVQTTTETLTAQIISENNVGKYGLFVVLGGDGTFNEVLRGVAGRDRRPLIGYIPSGTVNDFARTEGIPLDYKEATDAIINGEPKPRGAMFINGIPAAYLVAAGMFTCVSYTTDQNRKRKIGKLAYYIEVLFRDSGRHGISLETEIDGEKHSGLFTFVAALHNEHIGGMHVSRAKLENGDPFYLILAKRKKGIFGLFASLCSMANVYAKKIENAKNTKRIVVKKTDGATLKALSEIQWNIDGEKGPAGDAVITYKPNQFELVLPRK